MNKKRIGIVGGGQLGQMLTQAAIALGHKVTVLEPTPNCPAYQVGARQIRGSLTDPKSITALSKKSDVLTFEIEHIDAKTLHLLESQGTTVHPSPKSLVSIKDKLAQKKTLQSNDIPTAPFHEVTSEEDISTIAKQIGFPFLLKSRFGGYDGRGNYLVKKPSDIKLAFETLGKESLYIEEFVPFVKELAVMVGRGMDNMIVSYPIVETIHKNNILHFTKAPAVIDQPIEENARSISHRVVKSLGGNGVFGIELFLLKDGKILVNEIAPRVHNSGHYTIEACHTSQFTQHILAITGETLTNPSMKHPFAVMVNILGERKGKANPKGIKKAEKLPGTTVHLYGKLETKPERKMGHITVVGENRKEVLATAKQARSLITI